ncbi:MAG: peptidoglycan-associated lipoprotein Pal [Thermodesulfobacteriota bacterium]
MKKSLMLLTIACIFALSACAGPEVKKEIASGAAEEKKPAKVEAVEEVKTGVIKPEKVKTMPVEVTRVGEAAPAKPVSLGEIGDVFFDYNKFAVRDDFRGILENNAAILKANKAVTAVIEGHCDDRGTNEYNIGLGESRASAVKNYLVNLGVEAGRISIVSYGEEKPFCKERNEDCRQKNRRAHFVVKK